LNALRRATVPRANRYGRRLSNVKTVGGGVLEYRVDFGPGYRIYFGRDGDRLVILLAGGMKKRQQEDIRQARANWEDYRNRKAEEKTRCH
jgi:putative addiction module killer protein